MSASSIKDQRDPRFTPIRRVLHENQIGCRSQWQGLGARCSVNSVVHNRIAAQIIRALDEAPA